MRRVFLIIIILLSSSSLYAQYYSSGSSAVTLRYDQIKSDEHRVVYPDYYYPKASIVDGYIDTVRSVITHGLIDKVDYIPVILYPDKALANGMVTWTPKRMELYTIPSNSSGYSLPWLKQLSVHEYRHVVQLSNLNRGLVKAVGYVIGEHAVGAAAALVPTWFYEGDAVLAETQLAEWGRGKQPEFSISTRAWLLERPDLWSYERWRVGSMRYEFPSIYELGYFSVWAGQTFYSKEIWAEMLDYCGRNPIFAIFDSYNIKRKYGVNREGVTNRAVEELMEFWESSAAVENSAKLIPKDYKWYEAFANPIYFGDNKLFVERNNKSIVNTFAITDLESGKSEMLDNSVYINSRAELVGDMVYWSEYKPSLFWENNSSAVIRSAKIKETKKGYKMTQRREYNPKLGDSYYVTYLDSLHFAYINFDKLNNPQIVVTDNNFIPLSVDDIEGWDSSVSGMAYDEVTAKLYLSIVNNSGVVLVSFDPATRSFSTIKEPSHVTISALRAKNGKLYYSSTASGKDELHTYDLLTSKEYQISESKLGSFTPTTPFLLNDDSVVAATTYKFGGYGLSVQKLDGSIKKEVTAQRFPDSQLIPDWYEWDLLKIDTINIVPESANLDTLKEVKRYRRFAHSFAPHSWLPLAVNFDKLINEREVQIGYGATVMSQNLLGGVIATAGYGYVPKADMGLLAASLELSMLPVHFEVSVENGGGYQQNYVSSNVELDSVALGAKKYTEIGFDTSLPMNFSDGRRARWLTPSVGYSYVNGLIVKDDLSTITGLNKLSFGLSWSSYKYLSERDLASPLGYYLSFINSINPLSQDFGKIYSLYGKAYLPGVAQNHSLQIEGNVQYQELGTYNYQQKSLYPQGCDYNFSPENIYATAVNYQLPIAYPDGGIKDWIFFRRIAAGVFAEYAHAKYYSSLGTEYINPYTYGIELMFDYNLLGTGTKFYTGISLYKPSDYDKIMVGFSFNVGL